MRSRHVRRIVNVGMHQNISPEERIWIFERGPDIDVTGMGPFDVHDPTTRWVARHHIDRTVGAVATSLIFCFETSIAMFQKASALLMTSRPNVEEEVLRTRDDTVIAGHGTYLGSDPVMNA